MCFKFYPFKVGKIPSHTALEEFSHGEANLHLAAVLVFQLIQEAVLQLQITVLVLHVWLQGQTSHDTLAVEVKRDTFNNISCRCALSALKNIVVLHIRGGEEIRSRALYASPELCEDILALYIYHYVKKNHPVI